MRTRLAFFLAAALAAGAASAEGSVELEAGAAFTGYNDVRIPADSGTRFSLAEDLDPEPALALRARIGWTFGGRHSILLLAAPLSVRSEAVLDQALSFQGLTFPAGTAVEALYRFDSFRLGYRFAILPSGPLRLAAGASIKLRSADIAIMSAGAYAHREDLGFVPLLSLAAGWQLSPRLGLLLDAEGLWSPFGRAEDLLFALEYRGSERAALRLGYRILEGGSEGGGKVYTFSLFHYAVAGIALRF